MKQSLTALVIYLDTYEVVSTQRWTDTLIATGLVSYPQISPNLHVTVPRMDQGTRHS